jgi:beta-glucosidase
VKNGSLPEEVLDQAVERILSLIEKYTEYKTTENFVFDRSIDHQKSVEAAKESMVLLKNEGSLLPLSKQDGILFIGGFAEKPRFQGGGSSHINSFRITDALSEARKRADIAYEEGFPADSDKNDPKKFEAAVDAARKASVVVIFAGLPDSFESEGYDREHMRLPEVQNDLITHVADVQKNVVVVLHNGSPVEMPWIDKVNAVLEAYLGGEGVGEAEAAILFGEANPSGKLPETFPIKLSDNPSFLNFPGKKGKVYYNEGIFVGYRYYDMKDMKVLFPFGHGLSYTSFSYGKMHVDEKTMKVTVEVTNTGDREGKEVVQLYIRDLTGKELRPVKELKGFEKVSLQPGETKEVEFLLDQRSFAYYDEAAHDWIANDGEYEILAGGSSQELPLSEKIRRGSGKKTLFRVHANTTIGEIMEIPGLYEAVRDKLMPKMETLIPKAKEDQGMAASEAITEDMERAILRYMPLRGLRSFGQITNRDVEELVAIINEEAEKLGWNE